MVSEARKWCESFARPGDERVERAIDQPTGSDRSDSNRCLHGDGLLSVVAVASQPTLSASWAGRDPRTPLKETVHLRKIRIFLLSFK